MEQRPGLSYYFITKARIKTIILYKVFCIS